MHENDEVVINTEVKYTKLTVKDFTSIAGTIKSIPDTTDSLPSLTIGDRVDIRPVYNDSLGDGVVIATLRDTGVTFAIHLDHIELSIDL